MTTMKHLSLCQLFLKVLVAVALIPGALCQGAVTDVQVNPTAWQASVTVQGFVLVDATILGNVGFYEGATSMKFVKPDGTVLFVSGMACTFSMFSQDADMMFYMNKGEFPDMVTDDCRGNSVPTYTTPDIEKCAVTSTLYQGEEVYVTVKVESFFPQTYTVVYECTYEQAGRACFSDHATVYIQGKGSTPMKDLHVGDKILVGDNYEPVYGFAHLDKTKSTEFLQIFTLESKSNGPLEVTRDHLLYVNNGYIPARAVQVGDTLYGKSGAFRVTKIDTVSRTGLYAPLTPSGTLSVNGIAVSSYAFWWNDDKSVVNQFTNLLSRLSLSHHTINHMAMAPIRIACMGISAKLCSNDLIDQETGYPPFVRLWMTLFDMFDQQPVFLVLFFSFICAPLYFVECTFGASLTPIIIAITATVTVMLTGRVVSRNRICTKKDIKIMGKTKVA